MQKIEMIGKIEKIERIEKNDIELWPPSVFIIVKPEHNENLKHTNSMNDQTANEFADVSAILSAYEWFLRPAQMSRKAQPKKEVTASAVSVL